MRGRLTGVRGSARFATGTGVARWPNMNRRVPASLVVALMFPPCACSGMVANGGGEAGLPATEAGILEVDAEAGADTAPPCTNFAGPATCPDQAPFVCHYEDPVGCPPYPPYCSPTNSTGGVSCQFVGDASLYCSCSPGVQADPSGQCPAGTLTECSHPDPAVCAFECCYASVPDAADYCHSYVTDAGTAEASD
jgi:hypothetical protein